MALNASGLPAWGGRYSQRKTAECLAAKGTTCHLCRTPGIATTADHVIPRSLGGGDELENLEPACQPCNSARQAMPLATWFQLHPVKAPALPLSARWTT